MARANRGGYAGMRLDIAIGTGFVLETGVYCIYTYLFIAALPVLTSARRRKDANSRTAAWVFLIFSFLMYLVATLHLLLAAFRFYKSILLNVDPKGPISYLQDGHHWEYLGLIALLCIQTWLGDVLVIYRCYVVWNNNLWLICIPICLLLSQIGLNAWILHWLDHPSIRTRMLAQRLRNSIYPLAFAQNFITTSLMIIKILLQHRVSRKAGVVDIGSKLSLIRVVRIVIESAAIYTIQILLLVILYFRRDSFQFAVQAAVTPSIGITFVLLAIRIEASRNERSTSSNMGARSTLLPQWAHSYESSFEHYRNCASLPSGGGNEVTCDTIDAKRRSGVDNSSALEPSSDSVEPLNVSSIPL